MKAMDGPRKRAAEGAADAGVVSGVVPLGKHNRSNIGKTAPDRRYEHEEHGESGLGRVRDMKTPAGADRRGASSEPAQRELAKSLKTAKTRVSDQVRRGNREVGIVLEVVAGPMDGCMFAGPSKTVRIGRDLERNDLALTWDHSVGRSPHAAVTWQYGAPRFSVEDLGSQNGTWVQGERITNPKALEPGDTFIVGSAAVRVYRQRNEVSVAPSLESVKKQAARARRKFGDEIDRGYGAAIAWAVREKRPFITDSHLFVGVACTNPEHPLVGGGDGPIGGGIIGKFLGGGGLWSGSEAWIANHFRVAQLREDVVLAHQVLFTPRLIGVLLDAEDHALSRGATEITATDLFFASIRSPHARMRAVLEREGVDISDALDILASCESQSVAVEPPGSPERRAGRSTPTTSSHDMGLDLEAREAALESHKSSGGAGPPPRPQSPRHEHGRSGVRPTEIEAKGSSDAARRDAESTAPDTPMDSMLSETIAPVGRLWKLAFDSQEYDLPELDPADRSGVVLVRSLVFALVSLDYIAISVAINATDRVEISQFWLLPGFRSTLSSYLERIRKGERVSLEELGTYLSAVEDWLVASVAAYRVGPEYWFGDFWKRTSPRAIEARVKKAARPQLSRSSAQKIWREVKDFGFGAGAGEIWRRWISMVWRDAKVRLVRPGASDFWREYVETVKDVTPELVEDEVKRIVMKVAEEYYSEETRKRGQRERSTTE